MEYYYTKKENVNLSKDELVIDDFEVRHLVKVLRKKESDEITVTDGERNVYYCKIRKVEKDKLICEVLNKDFNLFEPEINLSLYASPLRNLSRFEIVIEKAVELGVSSIHPVITEHTINKTLSNNFKKARLNKIIISAMSQSQRCLLPNLNDAVTFKQMLEETEGKDNKIIMYEFSDDVKEYKLNKDSKDVCLLIGPEGGFSDEEILMLQNNNWQVKSLGKRKMRAETAAIVSIYDIISKHN